MTIELDDLTEKANILNNIGIIYYDQQNNNKALIYFNKALDVTLQLKDLSEKAIVLNNIGNIYYDQGKLDEALIKLEEALKIDDELGDAKCKPQRLISIGNIYQNQKKTEEATNTFKEFLICIRKTNTELEDELLEHNKIAKIEFINFSRRSKKILEDLKSGKFLSGNDMIEKFPKISSKDRSHLNRIFRTFK